MVKISMLHRSRILLISQNWWDKILGIIIYYNCDFELKPLKIEGTASDTIYPNLQVATILKIVIACTFTFFDFTKIDWTN